MINILVPMAGKSYFFDDKQDGFSKPFVEICGKTMLEHFILNYKNIDNKHFIFVIKDDENRRFGLQNAINVLTNNQSEVIVLKNETAGMACSALMAVDFIDNDESLIIANMDQIFELNLSDIIDRLSNFDAGVLSFENIHPRFSYVKCDNENNILQAFEKKQISKNAIAGFYYFKKGSDFIQAAKNMIKKDVNLDGKFYVAPTLNELILQGKVVKNLQIDKNKYFTFYSHAKISEYERIKNA